jgi:very-short-patch-repair endonuclease
MHRAAELRKEPSFAEARLWSRLRNHRLHGVGFQRQHAIGLYIADFCAPGRKLVIEVDGSQHVDQVEYDARQTVYLAERSYWVLRFWNHEVLKSIEDVLRAIELVLDEI